MSTNHKEFISHTLQGLYIALESILSKLIENVFTTLIHFPQLLSRRECNKKQYTVEHVKTEMVKNGRHNHFSWTDKSQAEQTSCLLTAAFSILYGFGETHMRKQSEIKEGKISMKV